MTPTHVEHHAVFARDGVPVSPLRRSRAALRILACLRGEVAAPEAARSGSAAAHRRGDGTPPTPGENDDAAISGLRAGRPGGRGAETGGPAPGVWAHEAEEAKNCMEERTERYADAASRLHVTYWEAVGIGGPGGATQGASTGPHHGLSDRSSVVTTLLRSDF